VRQSAERSAGRCASRCENLFALEPLGTINIRVTGPTADVPERRPCRTEGRCGRTRPRLGSGGLRAEASKLFYGAAKLGDARSRAIQPASTRRSHLTPDEPHPVSATDGSVRLAVGLNHIEDIPADLDRALAAGPDDGVWRNLRLNRNRNQFAGDGGPPSHSGGARREVRNKACQTAFSR